MDPVEDGKLIAQIQQQTSYKQAGAEHTWRYKNKKRTNYDGRVRLVQNGRFPVGLLPRIIGIIRARGHVVSIEDQENRSEKPPIETRLDGMEARTYQDDAVALANLFDRGVIQVPTGGGKTPIMARIIDAHRTPALVVVPTIDLLNQAVDFFTEHLRVLAGVRSMDHGDGQKIPTQQFEVIGRLGGGVVDPHSVTVATIRTIAKVLDVAYESYEFGEYDDKDDTDIGDIEQRDALRRWVESIGTLFFDECHLLPADTAYDITNRIPARYKYGMSASPWRDDGADIKIEAATGPVFYRIAASTLVQEKYLVPPMVRVVPTKSWWQAAAWGRLCRACSKQVPSDFWGDCPECGGKEYKSQFAECYKAEIVENAVRNHRIALEVQELDCPTLVLVKQISHGRHLEALIPDSKFLSGKEKGEVRHQTFKALKDGEIRVIICTAIADMGMDLPNLQALVLAGGGKSSTRHLQRIGRVVRPYPGKSCGVVVDYADNHVGTWFARHESARRKIERAEWGNAILYV